MAAHHDDMPSMSSAPEPAGRGRPPAADSTASGSARPGIGPYGCQTCRRSARRRSPCRTGWLTASAPGASPGRTAPSALTLGADPHRDLHRVAGEAELLAQLPFHEPPVGGLEEAGGEQHEVRRAHAGLGGEQDLRLAAA